MPIFKLDDTKIRKIRRVVPEKKFKQTDKERNGHAYKQVNRQIDKRSNRKKKKRKRKIWKTNNSTNCRRVFHKIFTSCAHWFNSAFLRFVPGSLGSLCSMLLSLLGSNFAVTLLYFVQHRKNKTKRFLIQKLMK